MIKNSKLTAFLFIDNHPKTYLINDAMAYPRIKNSANFAVQRDDMIRQLSINCNNYDELLFTINKFGSGFGGGLG